MTFTDLELKAARELVDAATPGPWTNRVGIGPCDYIAKAERQDDAAFIAAARTLVPQLLDEVERLRKKNADLLEIAIAFANSPLYPEGG